MQRKDFDKKMQRRQFLRQTAAGLAAVQTAVWCSDLRAEPKSANEQLQVAAVGTSHRAAADIAEVHKAGAKIVALADVDARYLEQAAKRYQVKKTYADYREMIEKEKDNIDAVVVGTPDHHHAPATIRALRAGKHVYCEKPLTHTVFECRLVTNEAHKRGLVTQMGTQIHAGENYRRVVEIIQSGAIGDITEVHVWCGKGWGYKKIPELKPTKPPEYLSWDLWLGPAPERPYVPKVYHPANWRRWWDFGQGTLGDMACHYMDLPFWALGLRYPLTVAAEGPPVNPQVCPTGLKVTYEFPARGNQPAVKLTWYDGEYTPKVVAGHKVPYAGVMFIGSKGQMFANYTSYKLYPEEKFKNYQPPKPTIPRSIGHHKEWVKACLEGKPEDCTCRFDYSGPLAEAVLLGNVAYRSGCKLQWDAKLLKATNCSKADNFISKPYRKGWEVV